MSEIADFFKAQEKSSDKWIFLILFLFPVAGPVVKHWNSFFFMLISVTALYFLFAKKDRKPLYKEEKIFLWVFFLFFAVFIVSALVNGWTYIQTRELGVELKYLLFLPIYLLIREYNFTKKALFAGVLLSIPVIFSFSVYEYIYIMPTSPRHDLNGAYFHLFIGPITALLLLLVYSAYISWFKNNQYIWVLPVYGFMGLFVILFSQARLAHLTLVGGAIVLLLLLSRSLKQKLMGVGIIIIIMISAYQLESIKSRVLLGAQEVKEFFYAEQKAKGSLGLRLEVWRSAQYAFHERPLIGIGDGNYPVFIKKYVNQGLVNGVVAGFSQAHNTFVEALISKGGIGLLLLLMIFYYPVYLAWKNREKSKMTFVTISIFATSVTLISTGESMLINKDNATAYLLFFTGVLFSSMISEIKTQEISLNSVSKLQL